MADIELERRGPVAIVAINRPAKRNALDGRAWRQLGAIFEAFGSDPDLRAVVLTGRGGAFCAGDEIGAFAAVRDDPAARREYWDGIMACYAAVSAVPVPVVAAVSGPCVGGGCTLALRADFRIADGTARFGVPPAKLGLVYPADSTQLLAATAGIAMARHMPYTGQLIDSQAALDCGLVSQRIEGDVVVVYTLRQPRACAVEPRAMDGSCRAAGSHCIAQLPTASPGQAQRACSEGVGAGCSALLRQLREGTAVAESNDVGPARFERPPACREHTPGHDPQACEALTDDALAIAMQRVGQQLEQEERSTPDLPLPAAVRDRLQRLCLQHRVGRFCVEMAAQQLDALEPALAVQALQVVCDAGRVSACERTAPLRELGADLRLVPAQQVPCGRYQADGGVIDMLDFGNGTHARLHKGAIHLQHDGQSLVLRPLANGDLLGIDSQTAYQRYRPQEGVPSCSRPADSLGRPLR